MTTPTLRLGKLLINIEDVKEYHITEKNQLIIRFTDELDGVQIKITNEDLIEDFQEWYESLVPWRPGMQARIVPNAVFEVVDYNPGSQQLRVKWGSGTVHWLPAELFVEVDTEFWEEIEIHGTNEKGFSVVNLSPGDEVWVKGMFIGVSLRHLIEVSISGQGYHFLSDLIRKRVSGKEEE